MSIPSPMKPEPDQPVTVRRHRIDWEASDLDLAEVTAQRAMSLGPKLARDCWYLNARYTVFSPTPSAAFFRTVRDRRSAWLHACRQTLSNYGQRQEARKLRRQGQLDALIELHPTTAGEGECSTPPEIIPWSMLTEAERQELIENGRLAKQLGFSGVLFSNGELIAPRTWQKLADELLSPTADAPVTITRRKLHLAALKAAGDVELLRSISRSALQQHLDRYPSHAAYVNPLATVSASAATPAFYVAAKRTQAEWCTLLNRALGCGNVRRAIRASDDATIALVYRGTLVVDGQLYLPGLWPNQPPNPGRLKRTPLQAPTVPPAYLSLTPHPG